MFATDPSGAFMECKAGSKGEGCSGAMAYFEENYKEDMTLAESIDMGVKAVHKGNEGRLNPDAVEIAVVDAKEKFRVLPRDESKTLVKKAMEEKIC